MDERIKKELNAAKRIVVKVGTSTLTYDTGKMNLKRMDRLAMVLSDLHNQGKEIVLVSSGAIGIAMGKLGLSERPGDIKKKQAIAAVGQCELMFLYDKLFSEYNNTVAQILLTKDDIAIPRRKRHTQNTVNALLEMGIIPIVNENDTISVDEIEIGDNDNLSAIVADLLDADLLVLFSDIDGLFDSDPRQNKNAKLFDDVYDIDEVIYPYETLNLILQPIVENAIEHGIDAKSNGEKGVITVKGWLEEDMIYISVKDNGVGMEEEKAATIITRHSKGYGIRNVNERIQLYYGEQYQLTVKSKVNEGTCITVCIPAREMQKSG